MATGCCGSDDGVLSGMVEVGNLGKWYARVGMGGKLSRDKVWPMPVIFGLGKADDVELD